MDDAYDTCPVGSLEHCAAYEKQFIALDGIGAAIPGDPQASYEADYAYELAYERENEYLYQEHVEENAKWWRARWIQVAGDLLGDPRSWLGEDWWQSRIGEHDSEPDIDLEPF